MISRARWPDEQVSVLKANLLTPLDDLMPLINAAGPERTRKAVSDRRGEMVGAPRREPGTVKVQYTGWPLLEGTDEERDAEFVKMVLRAMLEEQRRKPAPAPQRRAEMAA